MLCDFAQRFLGFVEQQQAAGTLDKDTSRYYKNGWRLLAETEICRLRLDQICTSDASVLAFSGGPSNANNALRTLRRMLSQACEWGILRAAPRVRLVEELGRDVLIEPYVEDLLLKFAPQPLTDVLVIMLDCGMRPEEVMRMRWEDVMWERSVILVPFGKSFKSKRFVPLSDRMRIGLTLRQADSESEWVFPAESSSGHRVNVSKQWLWAVAQANEWLIGQRKPTLSDRLVLYSARHTFATNLLAKTGDLAKVMRIMGHSSIATTQKYLHPSIADVADVINKHNRDKSSIHLLASA